MTLFHWNRTAANNGTADVTCPFPEGMGAPALNDGARGMMAAVSKYRDDMAGAIVTGGTSTAYTVSSYQGFDSLANMNGQEIAFSPHATNGDTVLLNVDSLGAKPLRSAPGVELLAGTLVLGTPYMATYNNADAAWYLKGYFASPFNVPFLGGMDFWDTIAPNSAFIFPQGQAISRTVYSRAFARWGTAYGVGDGSTTFNVPDKTGRVSAMKEAAATRLTSAGGGVDGSVMGAAGGVQTKTLLTANLPPYTPTASAISVTSTASNIVRGTVQTTGSTGTGGTIDVLTDPTGASGPITSTNTGAGFTGVAQGGVSTPIAVLPPLIVCNYIIRIL